MNSYQIIALNAFSDNYIWVIHDNKSAIVVDPGVSDVVIQFLKKNNLDLIAILLTHNHNDHNGGVSNILANYPKSQIYNYLDDRIADDTTILFSGFPCFKVIATPGHTLDHVCYLFDDKHLFCGDTLFSMGCGRVFTNDFIAAYDSLCKIKLLSPDVLCYPAHEYTTNNLRFITSIDDDKSYYQDVAKYVLIRLSTMQNSLPTTLETELKYNLFLRCNEDYIKNIVSDKIGEQINDDLECFIALRNLRNNF